MVKEPPLSDQMASFLAMVERTLRAAKLDKISGELEFKAHMRDGGIMDAYKTIRTREKSQ